MLKSLILAICLLLAVNANVIVIHHDNGHLGEQKVYNGFVGDLFRVELNCNPSTGYYF